MPFLAKKTPLWALVLAVVVTAGSSTMLLLAIPQLSDGTQALRDFSLAASPSSLSVNQGSMATTTITATSINGFDLSIGMTVAVAGNVASFLLASLSSNVVTPSSYGTGATTLTVTSLTGTPAGTYQITLSSSGGTRSHNIAIAVSVGPADFTIVANPSFLTTIQGQFNTTTLTLTSQGGFSGDVSLTVTAPLAVIGTAGGPSPAHLIPGGSATSAVTVEPSTLTNLGNYTIIATGTAGGLTHSVHIQVLVKRGGFESLVLESYSFPSSTNATMYIRNTGTANVTFASYYVKDGSGNQYALTSWSGPNILPNNVAPTIFLIGSSCPSCTLVGTPFMFQVGYTYTIVVVTTRNNQFSFVITR
jgi:uncharacterized membrane protein